MKDGYGTDLLPGDIVESDATGARCTVLGDCKTWCYHKNKDVSGVLLRADNWMPDHVYGAENPTHFGIPIPLMRRTSVWRKVAK